MSDYEELVHLLGDLDFSITYAEITEKKLVVVCVSRNNDKSDTIDIETFCIEPSNADYDKIIGMLFFLFDDFKY
ncbi:hypothetical protein JXA31_02015 [Candidatus Bathyarchaeota archaeon]|nr:hypothetical protein [Candidatus Bathyarchaeota archaeon]